MAYDYDLCVIGAGPSGYAAAMRALDFNKKVALIEKRELGGAGITNGALSSKTMWELSRDFKNLRKNVARFGGEVPTLHFSKVIKEVQAATSERIGLLRGHLQQLVEQDEDDPKIQFIKGTAFISEAHQVTVELENGDKRIISCENIILATGSRPRKLDHIPIDEEHILTSDGIEHLKRFPDSLVILGAGVIGCEYATIFSNFNQTKVHIIDKGDRILPSEDADVVAIVEKNLEEAGVLIHRNSQLISMEVDKGQVHYQLAYDDGKIEDFWVDKALVSVGRVANCHNLWSPDLPIELDHRGHIKDQSTQTSISNIYAVGDITADIALVNVGELEGRFAVESMYQIKRDAICYQNVSTIMFLTPEVAGVGLNERATQKAGLNYRCVTIDYSCIARATAMRNTQGFVKIIISDDEDMKLLGMRVVGEHASSAIQAVALLISLEKGIDSLAELIHPHPSIIEGIQEGARVLMGKSIMKPNLYKNAMNAYRYVSGQKINLFDTIKIKKQA
ncbi:MAG: NAD(P)/FAD-dependent oxidoreductase [Cyclobacteriaceae bacterium]|nr:NAD(P)/FAD-dependent oxidoreductase [Cyclobacteriaceae bacterium]MCH8516460.1 NAD(P)/FAD-dependent oxidoreductase [Cyclobacteriaceae bacterium]